MLEPYKAIPALTSSLQATPPEEELEELLEDELEELLEELLEEELEDDELEELLDDDEDAPPELLDEEVPGVMPPFVQPCRATAPAANKINAIFFIYNDPIKGAQ